MKSNISLNYRFRKNKNKWTLIDLTYEMSLIRYCTSNVLLSVNIMSLILITHRHYIGDVFHSTIVLAQYQFLNDRHLTSRDHNSRVHPPVTIGYMSVYCKRHCRYFKRFLYCVNILCMMKLVSLLKYLYIYKIDDDEWSWGQ